MASGGAEGRITISDGGDLPAPGAGQTSGQPLPWASAPPAVAAHRRDGGRLDIVERAIAATHDPALDGNVVALPPVRKAAVIIRLLKGVDSALPLDRLSPAAAARLLHEMTLIGRLDARATLAVVEEFLAHISQPALRFPSDIEDALAQFADDLPAGADALLQGKGGNGQAAWQEIAAADVPCLARVLADQGLQVRALVLSRLEPTRAAELLAQMPPEDADALVVAAATMGPVSHEVLDTVGRALAGILQARRQTGALPGQPLERVAEILNFAPGTQRDALLERIEGSDAEMATRLRRAMFTFADIPARVQAADIPRIVRATDNARLVTALAGASGAGDRAAADYLLGNISKRLAEQIREEMAERPAIDPREADAAMTAVIAAIRRLERAGDITLVPGDGDDRKDG